MRNTICYKLKFTAPLHISAPGVGYESVEYIIHSDTLFSALINAWRLFYPEDVETFFNGNGPPFLVSSAFPFKASRLFFPKPSLPLHLDLDSTTAKKLKRVQFVEKALFERILQGQTPPFDSTHTLQHGAFWIDNAPDESRRNVHRHAQDQIVFHVRETPRVTIDRRTSGSEIFYFSDILFEPDGGLFFLARFSDSELRSKFETILRLLGDEGIGADRTSGRGAFKVQTNETFSLDVSDDCSHFTTLALYHPTKDEVGNSLLAPARYELVSRTGWVHSRRTTPYRRKTVKMFSEGSVFTGSPSKVYGDMPEVLEESFVGHKIYRYGYAFSVGLEGDAL